MSESRHTPGPWFVGDLDKHSQRVVRNDHIEIATCWHHSVGSIEREMEVNARLIAAAPELLEALLAMRDAFQAFRVKPIGSPGSPARAEQDAQIRAEDMAIAAIRKATGGK